MDDLAKRRALATRGVVAAKTLGSKPRRTADRDRLVEVQPQTYLAQTQPYDVPTQLASLQASHREGGWTVLGEGALWLYGVAEVPRILTVGIPVSSELAIRRPVRLRRVAPSVLLRSRTIRSCRVVALEIAVIQWAVGRDATAVLEMVERVVRERLTTVVRLRARLRRGLAGSAAVRRAIDTLAGGSLELDVRRLRAALERRGVTGLEAEVHFTNAAGASAYADLFHKETATALEVDAALDHLERRRFRADRRRDRWMLKEHAARTIRVDVMEIREDLEGLADELLWLFEPKQSGGSDAEAS